MKNPVSQLAAYELKHLVTHLDRAKRWNDLHRLLSLETEDGRNAWYEAKRASDADRDYIRDVSVARGCIDADSLELAVEARYALVGASLRSRGGNAPPGLVNALVRSATWPVAEGIRQARRLSDPASRACALVLLSEFGGVQLLHDAVELLPAIPLAKVRDATAQDIAERYASLGESRRAIAVLGRLSDGRQLCEVLANLLAAQSKQLMAESGALLDAMTRARRLETLCCAIAVSKLDPSPLIERASREWQTLRDQSAGGASDALWECVIAGAPLMKHLPADQQVEFLSDVHEALESIPAKDYLVGKIAPWLPPVTDRRVLDAILGADFLGEDGRAKTLALLAPALRPDDRAEAVRWFTDRTIEPSSFAGVMAACMTLQPEHTEKFLDDALAWIDREFAGWERSHALEVLAPKLSASYVTRAVGIAATIERADHRFNTLYALARRCADVDSARALLNEARRFYDPAGARPPMDGFRRRCELLASALPHLSGDEQRTEVMPLVARAQSTLTLSDDWDGAVCLLPFVDETNGAEDVAMAACAALLDHHFVDRWRIERYFERLPRRYHKPVLARILEHAEAGARNRVLEQFATHLSAEDLARVAESQDAITDAPAVAEALVSLRELANQTPDGDPETAVAVVWSTVSQRVGVRVEEAAQWVHLLVAKRLAAIGHVDDALAATKLIEPHTIFYSRAMGDLASRMPRDWIRGMVDEILAASPRGRETAALNEPGALSASARANPRNLVWLLGDADPDFSREIRNRTVSRSATAYGRAVHFAEFVPAVAEDRAQRIEEFIETVEHDPSSQSLELLESIVPFIDPSLFQRCADMIDRVARDQIVAARAALAVASRDGRRFHWAIRRCGNLDKWQRVPCAVTHYASFSGNERVELSRWVAQEARARLLDRGTVLELCMVALVPEDEADRVALLGEALEAAATNPHLDTVRQNHTLIAAYLVLVADRMRVRALRIALDRGFTNFRGHLLTALQGLGPVIRSVGTATDLEQTAAVVNDVARWWP